MDCNSSTVLSLCSGAGGIELGLKLAMPRARTVCYVEGEVYAAAQLAARMEDETMDGAPIWSNVKTFDPKPWRGCVDIITAGYPCQPFSIAGAKRAEKDPRHLWPYIREIVRTIEPGICFFENVSHHLRLGFEQVHDDLRAMGYSVAAGLFTAEEVGAPHKRERLFILAYRDGDRFICEQGTSTGEDDPQGWAECSAHTRTRSGKLGVEAIGGGGNFYTVNVDARGSSDPAGTSVSVRRAVDEALSARIPGIVETSARLAHRRTVDSWQRRGSRFE